MMPSFKDLLRQFSNVISQWSECVWMNFCVCLWLFSVYLVIVWLVQIFILCQDMQKIIITLYRIVLFFHSNSNLFKLLIINTSIVKAKKLIYYDPRILLICIATCYENKNFYFLTGNKSIYHITKSNFAM